MEFKTFKSFIFDMDGTLVDSQLNFDAMREELQFPCGVPLLEYIEELRGKVSKEEIDHYFKVIHHHEMEGAKRSIPYDGVEEFLEYLHQLGIKTAVLTRNSREVTEATFKKWKMSFEVILTRDCVLRPKPDPEGLFEICRRLNVDPQSSVYMGDFLFDLEAAKNAGMKAILFQPETHLSIPDHEREADYVVHSFRELKKQFTSDFLERLGFKL